MGQKVTYFPGFLPLCPPLLPFSFQRAFFTPEEFGESYRRPTRAHLNILPLFWTFSSNPLHVKQFQIRASGMCDAYSVIY